MDDFAYKDGRLHCEQVLVDAIAEKAGTPVYIYSARTLRSHLRRLNEAFAALKPLVCFSVKSCANLSVLKLLAEEGAGMDVVSGGELARALRAGVPASKCVFAGVGKTDAELEQALRAGIGLLNVESEAEFENLSVIAKRLGIRCDCALRINPDVDPKTHRYTSTGKKETKFGVDLERARAFFDRYGRDEFARLRGLHLHIGSPIYTIEPYIESVKKALALKDELERAGFTIDALDLGGGFGADYTTGQTPPVAEYAKAIVPMLVPHHARGLRMFLEPGRTIVGNAGILLTRVLYMKTSGDKRFAICDAGMQTLLRPSHYEAFHFIWPAAPAAEFIPESRTKIATMPGLSPCDVVGPICESGDFLAIDRALPPLARGDLLAVFTAGAYGMTMASRYNSSPLPAEVLVHGDRFEVVRRRESYDDLMAHELPLGGGAAPRDGAASTPGAGARGGASTSPSRR
ncbi:MAG: diaminopimelate decarboxylase [Phycisphaerae bacterium]|nr:diaminopimelate decarboxylase [Phycisphaerae bacterium]